MNLNKNIINASQVCDQNDILTIGQMVKLKEN